VSELKCKKGDIKALLYCIVNGVVVRVEERDGRQDWENGDEGQELGKVRDESIVYKSREHNNRHWTLCMCVFYAGEASI